ncbi:MAG TPA: prefoldin subunit alpha [Candidatus Lokiarchaeia archaeon]|nr:prefoldin subunit alpha [Candidatus Lokiarchaeia archaeon]
MENQDDAQQMAYFLQFAEEQLKELEMQRQVVEQGTQDITGTMYTIEKLDKEAGDENGILNTILPVGAGGFIRTSIQKPAAYMISIGAKYFMETDYEAGTKILEAQKEKMTTTLGIIEQRMKQLSQQAEQIRPRLEQKMQALRSGEDASTGAPSSSDQGDDEN